MIGRFGHQTIKVAKAPYQLFSTARVDLCATHLLARPQLNFQTRRRLRRRLRTRPRGAQLLLGRVLSPQLENSVGLVSIGSLKLTALRTPRLGCVLSPQR